MIAELISTLLENDIFLTLNGDTLKVKYNGDAISPELLQQIRANKAELIDYLSRGGNESNYEDIPALSGHGPFELSSGQRRLWVLDQFEENALIYNAQTSLELNQNVDVNCFKRAVNSLIERHEILRTVFRADEDGNAKQWILTSAEFGFEIDYRDFRNYTSNNGGQDVQVLTNVQSDTAVKNQLNQQVKQYMEEDAQLPFDMEKGPLFRAALLQTDDEEYVFYFNMHHIISDGWSMEVMHRDVFAFYDAYRENRTPVLSKLKIQYKDYSAWQLQQLDGKSYEQQKQFWLKMLEGDLPLVDLPTTKQRPPVKTYNGTCLSTYIDAPTTARIKRHAQESGGSLFVEFLAFWNVLVYHYTGLTDIITGTPVAGREHPDLKDQIGFYVNTLPLRNEVIPGETFQELYDRIKHSTLAAYGHQMYPFDTLVENLDVQRDRSRTPVFDILLDFHNTSETVKYHEQTTGEAFDIVDFGKRFTKYDLELHFTEAEDCITLLLNFNEDVYEEQIIKSLLKDYLNVLKFFLDQPESNVSTTDFLSINDRELLTGGFNGKQVELNQETVLESFAKQVIENSSAPALIKGDFRMTFAELDQVSNQLAHCLIKDYGVLPGHVIALKLDRDEWAIIALLATLKCGAAYVPVDPDYPVARKEYILENSGTELLLTNTNYLFDAEEFGGTIFAVDVEFEKDNYSTEAVGVDVRANDHAYIIYTSGSTGQPKGVLISHGALLNYLNWGRNNYGNNGESPLNFGLFTSLSFDLTVTSIYLPLINGDSLNLFEESISEVHNLLENYCRSEIDCIKLTPAHINLLKGLEIKNPLLKTAIVGGDALHPAQVQILREINPEIRVFNEYGPTEATVGCVVKEILPNDECILIGQPIFNTNTYILNELGGVVPIGVAGELCIGGKGLAQGYLNRKELTEKAFGQHLIHSDERLYKTGDLCRWLPSGEMEYLGRLDDQVKIRGFRIEPGEIDRALCVIEQVKEAVVIVRENQSNEKELIAYLTTQDEIDTNRLRASLKEVLPEYMIPSYFVQLDEIPLTGNGKVDKSNLPDPNEVGLGQEAAYVAPRNETELKLTSIWESVLEKDKVGVKDDFFVLGGHSLKGIRLINEYQKSFGVRLSLNELFENSLLEQQAMLITNAGQSVFANIPSVPIAENYSVSDAQRRLWVLSQFDETSMAYNIPDELTINKALDLNSFNKAIIATIERHEILRTVFKPDHSGEIKQWIIESDKMEVEIDHHDFRLAKNKRQHVDQYIREDAYKPFNLSTGPLFRIALLQTEEEEHTLYFNLHHIISDGWSMEVLFKDVFQYYEAFVNNEEPELETLNIQYKDYTAWRLANLEGEAFEKHKSFWLDLLQGELPQINLPATHQRPTVKTHNGRSLRTYLSAKDTTLLKSFTEEHGGSLFINLLATWNVLLYRYTAQEDIIIGTPVAGREHPDLENQIGVYINTLLLRNRIAPTESYYSFYETLKENTLSSYDHQAYPFDRLVEDLEIKRDTSRNVGFDVMLMLQNTGVRKQPQDVATINNDLIEDRGDLVSRFDLGLVFEEEGDRLALNVEFNVDVYEQEMIEGLIRHYKQLVPRLLTNPERAVDSVDLLSETEKEKQLFQFNNLEFDFPTDKTIVDLFEEQVLKTSEKTAVSFENIELTYAQLNERANQLAHYLISNYNIQPDDLVAFKLGRSEKVIITILGILKSGAAYLPIDAGAPADKLKYITDDSGCKVVIDEGNFEVFTGGSSAHESDNPKVNLSVNNLIYVIYTSGSTGKPKGVQIEHKGLVAHIHNVKQRYGVSSDSRFLQFFNVAFDAAAQEIFTTLCFGATLYMKSESADPEYIYRLIEEHQITHADFSTAFFNSFIAVRDKNASKHQLDFCAIGGEKLEKGILEKQWHNIAEFTREFYNVYGPTETTLTATLYPIMSNGELSKFNGSIPIGKAWDGRQVLILNENQALQPVGVVGEICIGGNSLARGYLNRDELTAEKFIDHPFSSGERLYRTGDHGKWLPNGDIQFVGRIDDQVKIRGYRVELGEVEHILSGHEQVEQAIVIALENELKTKELVAYFTAQNQLTQANLKKWMAEQLPDYMIPVHFIQLDQFKLTTNGKIDKKALPKPAATGSTEEAEYMAPQTPKEHLLVEICEAVLKRERIGIDDNFYNLGGDSIKSIQLVARLKQKGFVLRVEQILRTPVLRELAPLMNEITRTIDQTAVTGEVKLTPIQNWFFQSAEVRNHNHFNQSVLLHSEERLNVETLEKTFKALTVHHDVLRMRYEKTEEGWQQFNQGPDAQCYSIDTYDLSDSHDPAGDIIKLGNQLQKSISLDGQLIRIAHFRMKENDRLGIIMHHLLVDGVSWRIILEDVATLYNGLSKGEKVMLPLKTDAFQTWSAALSDYANNEISTTEKNYWTHLFTNDVDSILDEQITDRVQADQEVSFRLSKELTHALQAEVHHVLNTEINDVLLASLGWALMQTFGVNNTLLRMEGHGREEILKDVDISRTVGWFTSVFPFKLSAGGSDPVRNLMGVKDDLRRIPNKGIGYGLLNYLSEEQQVNDFKPEITFNYLGDFDDTPGDSDTEVFSYAKESWGADLAEENTGYTALDVTGILVNGELLFTIKYSGQRFEDNQIEKLAAEYEESLRSLIEQLSRSEETRLTATDFTFKGLRQDEVEQLNVNNNLADVYELSPLQEGIYYHWLSGDSTALYFEQAAYRVKARNLPLDKLERAYVQLIQRHAVLRTWFSNDYAGRTLQIVAKKAESNFNYEEMPAGENAAAFVEEVKNKDRNKGFDLHSGVQMRLQVLALGNNEYEFIWSYHHILMDGWCISVLMNDFNELFTAETYGHVPNLSPVVPYSNYISWLKELDKEKSLNYWKNYLFNYSEQAIIPFGSDDDDSDYVEANEVITFDGELFQKIETLINEAGVTLNTFIQAVWGYLLGRYNDRTDVVFGAVVSGRPAGLAGVEEMIGLFNNTIPVRVSYEEGDTPIDLLKKLQEESIESTAHHYMNLSEVQSQSELRMNLIDHIMVFENYAVKELDDNGMINRADGGGLEVSKIELFDQTNYDFNLTVLPAPTFIEITVRYNSSKYNGDLIKRMQNHFDSVINEFIINPNNPLTI